MPESDAPEMGEMPTPDTDEGTAPASIPDRLPDDHPLVKAYNATKSELGQAKSKVREFEDASKSEHERLTDRASELERNLTTAEANAVRYEVAIEKGLTKSQAKRLVGTTREEIETDADELLADLGIGQADDDPKTERRRPRERLKPGSSPDADPEPNPKELADKILSRGF